MTDRFNRAYNALVKAFFDGTLAKANCVACAVGNIVADAQGGKVKVEYTNASKQNLYNTQAPQCSTNNAYWGKLFTTSDGVQDRLWYRPENRSLVEALERLTEYKVEELAKVEYAFEINTDICWNAYTSDNEQEILEDQYKGLCAVVDVLLELDDITPEPKYNAKFREHKKLQAV